MKRKHASNYERWVGLHHYELKSAAWASLSGNAIKVLIDIWRRNNGMNDGEISYGVRESIKIRVSRSRTSRASKELIEKGFLVVTRKSAFTLKTHEARCFQLTDCTYFDVDTNSLSAGASNVGCRAPCTGQPNEH